MSRDFFFSTVVTLAAMALPCIAHADLLPTNPGAPQECASHTPGERCHRFDDTAGVCVAHEAATREGHAPMFTCERDSHECDSLAIGAACQGYLGHPATCQQFTNDRGETWRDCMVTETETAPSNSAPPGPATVTTVTPAQAHGCTISGTTAGTGSSSALATLAALSCAVCGVWMSRRR